MSRALQGAITAARWALALAITMYVFRWLAVFALSPFGVISLSFAVLGASNEALGIALGAILALTSLISIGIGAFIAPHRYWQVAIGLFSIAIVLPMAVVFVQDTFISGDSAFDVTELVTFASVAAGCAVLYGVLRRLPRKRPHPPALSNRASLAILIAFTCLLLLPVGTVTVPAWRLKLVDAREQPLANLGIRQSWIDFSVDAQTVDPEEESRATDAEGIVAFPARVRWASLAVRLWRPVDTDLTSFRHRSEGRHARLRPLCPLRSFESQGIMDFRGTSLPNRLHLIEDDGPRGGLDPPCERLLEQVRAAQAPR
jgi:hypothetical protein